MDPVTVQPPNDLQRGLSTGPLIGPAFGEVEILRGLQRYLVRYVEGPGPEDVRAEVEDLLVLIDIRLYELTEQTQVAA